MKASLEVLGLALGGLLVAGAAYDSPAPVSDALRSAAERAQRNLVAAAAEMPADKYGFKPTPAQMSFGQVIGHLAGGNDFLCARIGGVEAPKRSPAGKDASKQELVDRLKESFKFCDTALAQTNDAKLDAKVPFFEGGDVTRAAAMFAAVEDWADHYSQLAIYLRLNGLLPPTAKQKS
jgi:uncharacterized damage-inducible protein DinB